MTTERETLEAVKRLAQSWYDSDSADADTEAWVYGEQLMNLLRKGRDNWTDDDDKIRKRYFAQQNELRKLLSYVEVATGPNSKLMLEPISSHIRNILDTNNEQD